jgi:FkbM family methyltransferase
MPTLHSLTRRVPFLRNIGTRWNALKKKAASVRARGVRSVLQHKIARFRARGTAAVVRQIVRQAGEDGVLACTVNDCRLNVPGGMLMMFGQCLHASRENPLCYYVENRHLQWMRARLGKGDVAVDVGASGGLLTAALARTVGPAGRVFAFEPADRAFGLLRRLAAYNGLDNVTVEKRAVSSAPGTVQFAEYPFSPEDDLAWRPEASALLATANIDASRARTYEVPVTTLDEYFAAGAPAVNLVKIDVEGFEIEVLRGAARLIARDHPAFCIDIHQRVDGGTGTTEEPVRGLLAAHGYRFEKLDHVLTACAQQAAAGGRATRVAPAA